MDTSEASREVMVRRLSAQGYLVEAAADPTTGADSPGESLEALVDRADRATYTAKVSGRNRVVIADGAEGQSIPLVAARASWAVTRR